MDSSIRKPAHIGRTAAAMLLCALLILGNAPRVRAEVPGPNDILAEAAVLMDADSGQILWKKNADRAMHPASITKIMTAMLALETLEPDHVLSASAAAVDIPYWGSSAYIQAGERLTVDEAMHAMMLRSANEAANILAEAVAGSMDAFAERMTNRAAELGATGTRFTNANGLPARGHLTTAADMALITRAALVTPGFSDYFGAASYAMGATNRSGGRTFTNTHRMLQRGSYEYDDAVLGGKTGYTASSGYTLVTAAEQDGRTLICVVLNSAGTYADTRALLDFGFGEFVPYTYRFGPSDPVDVPVLDSGWEAGVAQFFHPDEVTLLLHQSVRATGIAVEYELPDALEPGQEAAGNAVLRAQSGEDGLPEALLVLPLEVEMTEFDPPVVEASLSLISAEQPGYAYHPALPVVAAAGLLGIAGLAVRIPARRRLRRRARQRRLRWESRMRAPR